jgi:hypothetical protein
VKVTLKNPSGFSLQARGGYFAPKTGAGPATKDDREISEALFSRDEVRDIPLDLETQFYKPDPDSAKLAVVAKVDVRRLHFQKADGRNNDTLTVVAGVFDRDGNMVAGNQKTIEMKLRDETLSTRLGSGIVVKTNFDVAPGEYTLRLLVRDSEGQTMATRNGVVNIP